MYISLIFFCIFINCSSLFFSLYRPHQSYIMMVPLKTPQTYIQYAAPQPTYQYATQPIQYTHQAIVPENTIEYTAPQHQLTAPEPVQYTSHSNHHHQPLSQSPHVQIQQSIEYPSQRIIEYTSPHSKYPSAPPLRPPSPPLPVQSSSPYRFTSTQPNKDHITPYGAPTLDYFGSYSKHASLLDSYIPSSVILERQKTLYNSRPPISTPSNNGHSLYSSGNSSPILSSGYNTIAYSAPLTYNDSNHLKRSAAPVKASSGSKITKLEKSQ